VEGRPKSIGGVLNAQVNPDRRLARSFVVRSASENNKTTQSNSDTYGAPSANVNIPILSPGTGNGNFAGGKGGTGGSATGSSNAGNQAQVVSNCG
jgi:hypothetical protein